FHMRKQGLFCGKPGNGIRAHMENAAERLRAYLEEPGAEESGPAPLHWLCMGIVLLRLGNGDSVVRRGGHAFVWILPSRTGGQPDRPVL
ncbi:hypothetical protein PZH39_17390, partial [Desulfovibrio desulfuricans]|uniref:hypothetical protein n=1 Tax=Desulfovibrio desulfuricans TaxID=876 RepID=UPI0023B16C58